MVTKPKAGSRVGRGEGRQLFDFIAGCVYCVDQTSHSTRAFDVGEDHYEARVCDKCGYVSKVVKL